MSKEYHGSCLCGEIRFSVTGFSDEVANCHCTMCRKFHGAAFGTLVQTKGLRWLNGVDYLTEFEAPNGSIRSFCRQCGSSLGFRGKHASVEDIEISIATFDQEIPVVVDAQIFIHYKANWSELQANLPTFEEARVKA